MKHKYEVIRTVTLKECPWLDKEVQKGELVFRYYGCTYGCIADSGLAVTFVQDVTPFFELPRDALRLVD